MRMCGISCAVVSLVMFLLCAGPVGAQTTSAANFSGPVQLPGVLLPAGSYTFALIRDGRTVMVSDATHQLIATLHVVPITRAAAGAIITMRSAVGTAAPEISGLYTSGGREGVAFLYHPVRK